jgi:hypothetical protein
MINEDSLRARKAAMLPDLDERQRRLFDAAEAKAAGHGGSAAVAGATRIAASTIGRGPKDLEAPETLPAVQVFFCKFREGDFSVVVITLSG